jgi:hypothetical protein
MFKWRESCQKFLTVIYKIENRRRMYYKSELLNLLPSIYFASIFLYYVHFKLFNTKKAFSYFYRLLVEYKDLPTVNGKTPK